MKKMLVLIMGAVLVVCGGLVGCAKKDEVKEAVSTEYSVSTHSDADQKNDSDDDTLYIEQSKDSEDEENTADLSGVADDSENTYIREVQNVGECTNYVSDNLEETSYSDLSELKAVVNEHGTGEEKIILKRIVTQKAEQSEEE